MDKRNMNAQRDTSRYVFLSSDRSFCKPSYHRCRRRQNPSSDAIVKEDQNRMLIGRCSHQYNLTRGLVSESFTARSCDPNSQSSEPVTVSPRGVRQRIYGTACRLDRLVSATER